MALSSILRQRWFPLAVLYFMNGCVRLGLVKAMGIIFEDIQRSIPMDSADLGIAIGLLLTVGYIFTPVTNFIYDRSTRPRLVLVLAAVMGSCPIILASLATTNIHLFVVFTITGMGQSAIIICVMNGLDKLAGANFNVVFCLCSSGYSVGMVLIPYFAELLLEAYGWRGVLLVLAGIMLNLIPCAMATYNPGAISRENNAKENLSQSNNDPSTHNHEKVLSDSAALENECDDDLKEIEPFLDKPEEQGKAMFKLTSTETELNCKKPPDKTSRLENGLVWFRETELYADPIIAFIFVCDIVLSFVYTGWHAFLIPHALRRGYSQHEVIIITFMSALGNLSGRLISGLLTHRFIEPVTLHLLLSALNVIALLCDVFIPNFYVMLVTSYCSALSIPARAVLQALVIRGRLSPHNVGTAFGVHCFCSGCGYLIGGYFTGLMDDQFSSYDASFKLLAGIDVATFLVTLPLKIGKKPKIKSSTT